MFKVDNKIIYLINILIFIEYSIKNINMSELISIKNIIKVLKFL